MKASFCAAVVAALAFASPVMADFFLYSGSMSDEFGTLPPEAKGVEAADRDNCNGIDSSPDLDGAEGDVSFPWPETTFKPEDVICGIALRFEKNGDNYDVFDDVTGDNVGSCTKGSEKITPCFFGAIAGDYIEDYSCASAVCA